MKMKNVLTVLALSALAAFVTTSLLAGCGTPTPVLNVLGWQKTMPGALGTTLLCKFWQVGNLANNSGTCPSSNMATPYSTGFYVTANWQNGGVNGCPGLYPPTGTRTAFLYTYVNPVTGGFAPSYIILSTAWSTPTARYDFDAITNGNGGSGNTEIPIRIPQEISRSSAARAGGYDFTAGWTPIAAAALKGFYDSVPANNIITGLAIYCSSSATLPTIFTPYDDRGTGALLTGVLTDGTKAWGAGAWVGRKLMLGGVPYTISANTATTITITGPPADATYFYSISNANWNLAYTSTATARSGYVSWGYAGTDPGTLIVFTPTGTTYVAYSLLFDNALPGQFAESSFLGVPDRGPTAAGVFGPQHASLSGNDVTVAWQSNVESNVATYEIYWANMATGPFNLVSTSAISPKGNNSNYSVSFENPSSSSRGFYVKIRAVMMDGTYQDSQIMRVGGKPPTETQTPGSGNEK